MKTLMTVIAVLELVFILALLDYLEDQDAFRIRALRMIGAVAFMNQEKTLHPGKTWNEIFSSSDWPIGVYPVNGAELQVLSDGERVALFEGVEYVISVNTNGERGTSALTVFSDGRFRDLPLERIK
jgi:hypothetical protein